MLNFKPSMKQDFECKFCNKKFHKETTLTTHMCVKKRRHMDADTAGSRFGFRTFQRFFDISMKSKKIKTQEEFINSQYYIDFVKFGNHIALLKPVYPDKFIDFVIMNSVNLKDWTKDITYDWYINDLIRKEPAVSATERTIIELLDWCKKNDSEFKDFFRIISPNEAAYMIKTGKISPWVLYLCTSGEILMNKFTEDHANMVGMIVDPGFWMKKFKKAEDDVDYIRNILDQVGL